MANDNLNSLLREYEQKRLKAEIDLETRKSNLFILIPRLMEIETELNQFAIQTTKNILNKSENSNYTLSELKKKIEILKKEKENILISNNYSLDYLKPSYECKICNDTGFVLDENYYKSTLCSCLKQKLINISINKSNIYNLRKENFNNFNENLFSNKTDKNKYNLNISPKENIINIKNKCLEFIDNFDNPEYKNLLFVGSTGLR